MARREGHRHPGGGGRRCGRDSTSRGTHDHQDHDGLRPPPPWLGWPSSHPVEQAAARRRNGARTLTGLGRRGIGLGLTKREESMRAAVPCRVPNWAVLRVLLFLWTL